MAFDALQNNKHRGGGAGAGASSSITSAAFDAIGLLDLMGRSESVMNQLAICLVGTSSSSMNNTPKESREERLLEAIVISWDGNGTVCGGGADIFTYEKLIADISLRLMMHRGDDVPSKNKHWDAI